ncbi:MAG: hypothetical protein UR28_C0020G0035 [Candidatus Peregrinibacteria bacterium GW2011_GWF2_33_10]|nr:MAG: hypothetical protein UR28_C0020G0035 [Candidatus Peregrinibacteria bacterium GW2011_GWF2_33_10]
MFNLLLRDENNSDKQTGAEKIEIMDGEPVISLERALRFLYSTHLQFPEWGNLRVPYSSKIEATSHQAYSAYSELIKNSLDIDLSKTLEKMTEYEYERYTSYIFSGIGDVDLWDVDVPDIDELRDKYPEGSYIRNYLEYELAIVRVRIKEAFQIIYNRAFGPFGHGEIPEKLNAFRVLFTIAMRSIGVEFGPIRMTVVGVEDHQIVSFEELECRMPDDKAVQEALLIMLKQFNCKKINGKLF